MALCGWYFGKLTYKAQQDENEVTSKASKVFNWCYVNPEMVRFFNSKNIELTKFKQLIEKSAQFYYKLSHAVAANTAVLKTLTLMMFVQGFGLVIIYYHIKQLRSINYSLVSVLV